MRLNDEGIPMAVQEVAIGFEPELHQHVAHLKLCDGKSHAVLVGALCEMTGIPAAMLTDELPEYLHEICYMLEDFAIDHWREMHSKGSIFMAGQH